MTQDLRQRLARFGIEIGFDESGFPELRRRGANCSYSSFAFVPIIGLGVDGHIVVRRCRDESCTDSGQRYRRSLDRPCDGELPSNVTDAQRTSGAKPAKEGVR